MSTDVTANIEEQEGDELDDYQLQRLNHLLVFASQCNFFYKEKLKHISLPVQSREDLLAVPFTTKQELVEDQQNHPPFGNNHSYEQNQYVRFHQTSGTTGKPLKILDTKDSWEWWADCWMEVLNSSGVSSKDRVFLAFSFGPFIGFWAAYEGAKKAGTLVIPGGGQTSKERLSKVIENNATVLLCTPSYALHLIEVADENGLDLGRSPVTKIITAGEPGGSIPSVRNQIENHWGAKVYDHVGMTEMGAYGFSCSEQKGIHLNKSEFLCEIIDRETLEPVNEGESGELVLTNFGRYGYPLIRYRTGDLVRRSDQKCVCGNTNKFLPGGILSRTDHMVTIRGVNIYPQSIESILRGFTEITEFRIIYYTEAEMDQVKVQIESREDLTEVLMSKLRERVGLRIPVEVLEAGALPRFTMKSKRVLDQRN